MEIIIAMFIAVLGWLPSHILTIRAQNKNFLNNIMNTARIDIIDSIKKYEDCLYEINGIFLHLKLQTIVEQKISLNWNEKISEIREIFKQGSSGYKMIVKLEGYEVLFPKTAECRISLLERQKKIDKFCQLFLVEIQKASFMQTDKPKAMEQRKKIIEKGIIDANIIFEQIFLMEDLKIYFQNFCLSKFTGHKIPERKPLDPSAPRLIQDEKGDLILVEKEKTLNK